MFTVSTDFVQGPKESTALLPPWKQKAMDHHMFDPDKYLFKGGAHMPLSGYLGVEPHRLPAGFEKRDIKEKAKLKAKQEALAKQKACGKGNGKTDGKTRKYERRELVRVNDDIPWLWDNASVRTSSAPVGKGYGMVTSPRIPRVAIRHGATEDGRAEDGHRTRDGITGRSALEARSLHGDGAVVPLAGQRFLHTARSLHGDGAVVLPVLSGV